MDDDEQESLPVFRHFTRDDLATINQLIFENKLAEKKKAEKLAKNKAVRMLADIVKVTVCCHMRYSVFR